MLVELNGIGIHKKKDKKRLQCIESYQGPQKQRGWGQCSGSAKSPLDSLGRLLTDDRMDGCYSWLPLPARLHAAGTTLPAIIQSAGRLLIGIREKSRTGSMKPIVFYHVDGIFGIRGGGGSFFFRYLFLCFLSFFWVLFTDGACALENAAWRVSPLPAVRD